MAVCEREREREKEGETEKRKRERQRRERDERDLSRLTDQSSKMSYIEWTAVPRPQ